MEYYIGAIIVAVLYGVYRGFIKIVRTIAICNFKKKEVAPLLPMVDEQLKKMNIVVLMFPQIGMTTHTKTRCMML